MTRRKMLASAVVTLTLVVALPLLAHAGGGGFGGGPLTGVFLLDCYKIVGGSNVPYTMDVQDQFGNHQSIKVGQAQLVCVNSGDWMRTPGSNSPALNADFDPTLINALKCYDAISPTDQGPGASGTIVDIFATTPATLKRLSTLCVPANLGE